MSYWGHVGITFDPTASYSFYILMNANSHPTFRSKQLGAVWLPPILQHFLVNRMFVRKVSCRHQRLIAYETLCKTSRTGEFIVDLFKRNKINDRTPKNLLRG